MTGKITLAIFIDNFDIFLWEARVLEEILKLDFVEIRLLILKGETSSIYNTYSKFYRLHEKLDKAFCNENVDYFKKINILKLVKGTPILSFTPLKNEYNTNNSEDVSKIIKEYHPDIILNLGHSEIKGNLKDVCKFGILSFYISDYRNRRCPSSGYWEVVKKSFVIGVTICIANISLDENTIIYNTGLVANSNSLNVIRNQIYRVASLIIPRILKGIYSYGNSYLENSANRNKVDIEIFNNSIYIKPSSVEALKNLIIVVLRTVFGKINAHNEGRWFLIFSICKKEFPLQIDLGSFKVLNPPKDRYWADPFVISKKNTHYIFIEEYLYKEGKGHISVLKLDQNGKLIRNDKIIEKSYHMSYPFVFELNNKCYMIPETSGNKTIELYECISFPYEWKFVMNLMENVIAVDSTLFFFKGKWWLFTSLNETKDTNIYFFELFLFYSDELFSNNWTSHPKNPINTDIKSSRQAGRIFNYGQKIFRPSQDCSGRYGKALNINLITKLSEDEYQETTTTCLNPFWDKKLEGMHTFNFNNEIFVIDTFQKNK